MDLDFMNVDRFCTDLTTQGKEICVDLSAINFFQPFALVYLGLFRRVKSKEGFNVSLLPPRNKKSSDYLNRQNFFARFNISNEDFFPAQLEYSLGMTDISNNPELPEIYAEEL